MKSVKIILSSMTTALCLFHGYFANPVTVITSDDDFETQIKNADNNAVLNVFYFANEAEYHDTNINNMISSHPTINVFKIYVESTSCSRTLNDFGIDDLTGLPTIMLRKFGEHICTLIEPEPDDLETKINNGENLVKEKMYEDFDIKDITNCRERFWKMESELADRSGKLVISYTWNAAKRDNLRFRINEMTSLEKSEVVVFRIRIDLLKCSKEEDGFNTRALFLQHTYPKIRFRKFRQYKNVMLGYNQEYFYNQFLEYKNMKEEEFSRRFFKENIFDHDGNAVNSVYYPENCEDFNIQLQNAERDYKFVFLFIDESPNVHDDSRVDKMAKNHPEMKFIRIKVADCSTVSVDYANTAVGKTTIEKFPAVYIRDFKADKSWYFDWKNNEDTITLKYNPANSKNHSLLGKMKHLFCGTTEAASP